MSGYILLEGGAEFGGRMAEPDLAAIALAGGPDAFIGIIPAAAASDHNHRRAGNNGLRWFQFLGARLVNVLPLIDTASANQPEMVESVRKSRLLYLLGGFPDYLGKTLAGSLAWQAMVEAYQAGAVIAGSSAGAMVLCSHYYDPASQCVSPGLGLIPNACVLPHHNTFGKGWARHLSALLPGVTLIGIDEQTGMLNSVPGGGWQVYGAGAVTVYSDNTAAAFSTGTVFSLPGSTD
ncbi:MAG: Type 1 glutamine amidotransferase-like domain-containing protein [Anaerolineales bacterium]|nr:Type 1 glutamine amidotransferase-like domain-containing protein [Anaerolineales bacterium]